MKIIDIQLFRKFYKENIRQIHDPLRNENFIGHSIENEGNTIFGFFEIFHADKKDINKFITPFLRMAQDWQAMYELLQNAYDAKSNKFALFTNSNALLAFNNGDQFSFEGIRSILNIGQSTKESKTNIGKYGVGFKIVHRLIGETDGLTELNKLRGPILFSWSQYSDLQDLMKLNSLDEVSYQNPEFTKVGDQYICENNLPWLFKILITNFPCAPKDTIYDLNYDIREDVFSLEDLKALQECVNAYIISHEVFNEYDLSQGTLIFLPLGSEKYKFFSEKHIKHGISLSLSILNYLEQEDPQKKLDKVYFNDVFTPFTPADINIEKFVIKKEHSNYLLLTESSSEDEIPEEIEYFMGISNNIEDTTIRNNPNLYLYFPISDEVHRYNFILHCNFFENLSQRTNLANSERNKKILYAFSQLLIKRLDELKKSGLNIYLRIYSSIILSDWKSIQNSSWVDQSLMEPLIEYCKNNIPTISEEFVSKQAVRVKTTQLNISPLDFGVSVFDWFNYQQESIISAARDNTKLGLGVAGLYELVSSSNHIDKINHWLNTHNNETETFLSELNEGPAFRSTQSTTKQNLLLAPITEKITALKLFLCSDMNYYSIAEIKSSINLLLLDNDLVELKDIFIALGFTVCVLDQSKLSNLYDIFATDFQHLNNKNKFLDYFSSKVGSVSGDLSYSQVENLVQYFNTINAPICSKIIFNISEEKYRLSPCLNTHQCFVPPNKPMLKNLIKNKLSELYIILDDQIYNLIGNKSGIHMKDELYLGILDGNLVPKEIIDIIIESESPDIQNRVLNNIDEFELVEGVIYNKHTYEHKILDIVNRINNDEFKTKIVIRTKDGSAIRLETIVYNNKVVFTIDDEDRSSQYELNLSKILPDYKDSSELIENISKSFIDFTEYTLRNNVFRVGKQKPKIEIFNELGSELNNAHQLTFILLYSKLSKNTAIEYSNYNILISTGELVSLNKNKYYVNNYTFISQEFILNEIYSDIIDLLKLNDDNPVFNGVNLSIFLKPFIKDNTYYCSPLKYSLKDEPNSQRDLFFNLYSEFLNQKISDNLVILEKTSWTQGATTLIQYTNDSKVFVFGFDPLIIVYPDEYGSESEIIPEWVSAWLNEGEYQKKINFLKAIGLNTEDSPLVHLRKYLINRIISYPTLEEIEELAKKTQGYLTRTINWLSHQETELSEIVETTDKYNLCRIIYSIIKDPSQHPLVIVSGINQNNQLVLRLSEQDNTETIFSISKEQKEYLLTLNNPIQVFEKLLSELNPPIIVYEDFYDSGEISFLNPQKLLLHTKLNTTKLAYSEELHSPSYIGWKDELEDRFKMYDTKYSEFLPYTILINDIVIAEISGNEIDITEDGKIYITKYDENISDLLQMIIGKNGFLQEHYDLFIEKKKNEPEEIDKLFDKEFEPLPSDIFKEISEKNSKFFPIGETKSFNEKLLELLSQSKSPWSGYIYHFTHIENAVKIINGRKVLSRNKADFLDSAGSSFINSTHSEIKNYARFYFRPKTPTQYYNEGLGKVTRNGDLPQCPVPIFFQFDVKEVLDKFEGKCYVSNGNLRHYPQTKFGNDYDFLRKFDFHNLYCQYGECDLRLFLNASQQEFVIENELDFSELKNYKIICPNNSSKLSLLNLIDNPSAVHDKISFHSEMYYNRNSFVEINIVNGELEVNLPGRSIDKLKLEIIYPEKSKIFVNSYLRYNSIKEFECKVYYINTNNSKEWLVYKNAPKNN